MELEVRRLERMDHGLDVPGGRVRLHRPEAAADVLSLHRPMSTPAAPSMTVRGVKSEMSIQTR
ncbi:MAG: hypothetical protein K2Q09_05045 [Phycisphaerales bacterium]|nr:hypothetical protein [Phycisphaerales bacterium]